jgi:hypothetical protein
MQHQSLLYDDIFTTQERTKKFKNGFREQSVRDLLRPNLRSAEEEDEDEEDAAKEVVVAVGKKVVKIPAKCKSEEESVVEDTTRKISAFNESAPAKFEIDNEQTVASSIRRFIDPIRVSQRRRLASRDAKNRNEETSYSGRNRCVRARDEEEEKGGCRAREGIVAGCKPLVKKIRSVRVDILCCCKFISCIVIYSSTSCAYVRAITISAEEEEAFVFVVVVAVVVVVAAAAAAAAVVVAEVKICSQR